MFDIGWSELMVVAVILVVVVGPKDLPGVLRGLGRVTRKMRGMADEFRRGVDEFIRESELQELKKSVDTNFSLEKLKAETLGDVDDMTKALGAPLVIGNAVPVAESVASETPIVVAAGAKPKRAAKPRAAKPKATNGAAAPVAKPAPVKAARKAATPKAGAARTTTKTAASKAATPKAAKAPRKSPPKSASAEPPKKDA